MPKSHKNLQILPIAIVGTTLVVVHNFVISDRDKPCPYIYFKSKILQISRRIQVNVNK